MTESTRGPRVLLITGQFWPVVGGAERQAQWLAAELTRLGHSVEVWTRRLERDWPRQEPCAGYVVRRLGPAARRFRIRRLERYAFMLALFVRMLLRRRDFDVVHVHQMQYPAMVAGLAARLAGRPCVARVACSGTHGDLRSLDGGLFGLRRRLVRRLMRRVVALDPVIRDECLAAGFRPEQLVSIPNGVSVGEARRPGPGLLEVAWVGVLRRQKRVDLLLRAWASAGEPGRLRIVGDGPERVGLEEIAHSLGLRRVEFAGEIADPTPALRAADVFALCSDSEGMSNALLEAMAAGCACIATTVGGSREALGGDSRELGPGAFARAEAGLLVPPGDPAALAAALACLADSAPLRGELGRAAHERCGRLFAMPRVAEAYRGLYASLVPAA